MWRSWDKSLRGLRFRIFTFLHSATHPTIWTCNASCPKHLRNQASTSQDFSSGASWPGFQSDSFPRSSAARAKELSRTRVRNAPRCYLCSGSRPSPTPCAVVGVALSNPVSQRASARARAADAEASAGSSVGCSSFRGLDTPSGQTIRTWNRRSRRGCGTPQLWAITSTS